MQQHLQISAAQASCSEARSQKITESFSIRLLEVPHDAPPNIDVNTQWQHIAHSLHTAAGEKVGYRRQQKSTWFDEECCQAAIEKNDAYQATLKSAATRAVYEKYREKRREDRRLFCGKKHEFVARAVYEKYLEKRREERHLFRRKQHAFVKADCEEIEMHGSRNDARQYF